MKWLESVLSKSNEKFVFVFNHFPGFSSGRPIGTFLIRKRSFKPAEQARDVIHPLLAKHRVSAVISACDFSYERSEPPPDKGVPQLIFGGGGAKLYRALLPGFLGFVLAEFFSAGLWVFIDALCGVRGHQIFSF